MLTTFAPRPATQNPPFIPVAAGEFSLTQLNWAIRNIRDFPVKRKNARFAHRPAGTR